jgi:para-aminobenzoate synthetase component 1
MTKNGHNMKPPIQDSPQGDGPWCAELKPAPDPATAFQRFASQPHCMFLDSATPGHRLGRFSFIMANPIAWQVVDLDQPQPFDSLRELHRRYQAKRFPGLPPSQGGIAGMWSYDLNRSLECISPPRYRDLETPAIAAGVYETVLTWDHEQNRCWVISHGLNGVGSRGERGLAQERIHEVCRWLQEDSSSSEQTHDDRPDAIVTPKEELAPLFEVQGESGIYSNFSREGFMAAVAQGIEYIAAGDIFQVNLAHRLLTAQRCSADRLYQSLRRQNPAPFAGYFDLGDTQIISASPERLIQIRDRVVESRPIKGTTQRTLFPEADLSAAESLRQSEKDRAENIMIVDLLRNDLSRICEGDSIQVTQLCEVEPYQYVQHLVSAIRGVLKNGADGFDVIEAIFPGGSITGAPKIRAMEIISELEPTPRGAYCGSLGYLGFDGTCDFNILIRTITAQAGWWSFPVGGGIVYQSLPEKELIETWHKARGLLRGLEGVEAWA